MSGSTEKAEILRGAHFMPMGGSQVQRLSRDEARKQKQLHEARKTGQIPREKDEDGKEINPHIPNFISKAPWYMAEPESADSRLDHQRRNLHSPEESCLDAPTTRGQKTGPAASKFRKGACTNCGAMSHATKNCLERPRKTGAKWTGRNIQADEAAQNVRLDFEAKRDRWTGYDPAEHDRVFRKFNELDEAMMQTDDGTMRDTKSRDQTNSPNHKFDVSTHSSTRNLRIREDKAKYLADISLGNSVEEVTEKQGLNSSIELSQQNFSRPTDHADLYEMQQFAWNSEKSGTKRLHLQANPTEGELAHRRHKKQKEARTTAAAEKLISIYGPRS